MDDTAIVAVVSEVAPLIVGRSPGKIFQLSTHSLAIDFGLRGEGFLFVSVDPAVPRLYLIKRRVRDLEKQSVPQGQFVLTLRKELSGMTTTAITKAPNDRLVRLEFESTNDPAPHKRRTLIAQLTGRSANLLLLDEQNLILCQSRKGLGHGQTVGERYDPPPPQSHVDATRSRTPTFKSPLAECKSISESLDSYYQNFFAEQAAQAQLAAARAQLRKEITRRKKLLKQLEEDLAGHADAQQHKQIGDLLLANISAAKRHGNHVVLFDYFADGAPRIEIEIDKNLTLPEEASRRFEMYARSKRARKQIAKRIEEVKSELADFDKKLQQLDSTSIDSVREKRAASDISPSQPRRKKLSQPRIPGTRRYVSSDGYEILVGRAAHDNDHLTFKVAKPNDLWLHAADYPGSHVIIRNSSRKEIPHRTLLEAAQLAAHFSQANKDPKVDVHYTPRKFLSKPKGAVAGLVRMSRFKNITVAPIEAIQRVV